MRIENGTVLTIENGVFEKGYVDFENGKITAFGAMEGAPAPKGEVLDAKGGYILPGFIDAHSHIGIFEESIHEGMDGNEVTDPTTPQLRALDAIYPFDTAFPTSIAGGVTSAIVGPGSANIIGGQMVAMKFAGDKVDDMVIRQPCAMKMALGENPKKAYGNNSKTPRTRMASAAIMRAELTRAKRYIEELEAGDKPKYDDKCEALIPVLKGEVMAHIHCHRSDDILTAIRVAKEFGLRYTIVHATDGAVIVHHMKAENIMPILGPLMISSTKPETMNRSMKTPGVFAANGVECCLTNDHPVVPLELLNILAALCVREGMDPDAALRAITINPAKVGEIDGRVGSIAVGKDADIVVWNKHPFDSMSKPQAVYIDGKQVL